jgi:hypothetical protein
MRRTNTPPPSLTDGTGSTTEYRPRLFSLRDASDSRQLSDLLRNGIVKHIIDCFYDQEKEYFQLLHPETISLPDFQLRFEAHRALLDKHVPATNRGIWVFFPWLSTIVHILDHAEFFAVRTARNLGLITSDEQRRFYEVIVGIAGLSIGNSVALAIVLSGGSRHIRLADFDTLALSNTNRVRSGVESLGLNKVIVAARQIYAVNPYARVEIFENGLKEENIARFVAGPPALDVMIDEFDDFLIKTQVRHYARQHRIPVVTGYDVADTGVLDIERYDLDPATPFFNGSVTDLTNDQLRSLNKLEIGRLLARHVGPENVTPRLQEAFFEVGKTLVSWPQLGTTALLNGSAVAYCVRRIVNNQPLISKRIPISLDESFIPDFGSTDQRMHRDEAIAKFRSRLGI